MASGTKSGLSRHFRPIKLKINIFGALKNQKIRLKIPFLCV